MTAFKKGDRVRVEYEAVVEYVRGASPTTTVLGLRNNRGRAISAYAEHCTPILPAEPPIGTVARDRAGDIWVRRAISGQWSLPGYVGAYTWPYINQNYGPLTFLYTPEEKA